MSCASTTAHLAHVTSPHRFAFFGHLVSITFFFGWIPLLVYGIVYLQLYAVGIRFEILAIFKVIFHFFHILPNQDLPDLDTVLHALKGFKVVASLMRKNTGVEAPKQKEGQNRNGAEA